MAWVALTPLIVALWQHARASRALWSRRAFLLGLTTGITYFAGTVYWTGGVMAQYGGLSLPVAAAIAGLLVAYLALFPAFFGLLQPYPDCPIWASKRSTAAAGVDGD